MSHPLSRGLLAGALGTLALDVASYADVLLRGRPASDVPALTVRAVADRLGVVTGDGPPTSREQAAGALAGLTVGVKIGALTSVARASGVRASRPGAWVLTGGLAMAVSDVPVALLGVSDPRTWTRPDWLADVVPHLAYGVVTHEVIRARSDDEPAARPSLRVLTRSFALGVAAGSRSTLGLVGAAWGGRRTGSVVESAGRGLSLLALAGELVADKLPAAPSRLESPGLESRLATASAGATRFAANDGAALELPVVAGAAGALVGSVAGAAWREAGRRRGLAALPVALAEDAFAVGLTVWVCRRAARAAG